MANGGFVPRRHVVKLLGAGGLALYLGPRMSAFAHEASLSARRPALSNALLADISPIDRSLGDMAPAKFLVGTSRSVRIICFGTSRPISKASAASCQCRRNGCRL